MASAPRRHRLGRIVSKAVLRSRYPKRWLVEASIEVIAARALIKRSSFGDSCRQLGEPVPVDQSPVEMDSDPRAVELGSCVEAVTRQLLGDDSCFPQAIAAARMLRRRSIAGSCFVGVRLAADRSVESHAWIQRGSQLIVGGGPHAEHVPILSFDL